MPRIESTKAGPIQHWIEYTDATSERSGSWCSRATFRVRITREDGILQIETEVRPAYGNTASVAQQGAFRRGQGMRTRTLNAIRACWGEGWPFPEEDA